MASAAYRPTRCRCEWTAISEEVGRAKQHRVQAVAERGQEATVQWLEALLFHHDPVGVNFEHNTDEYRAEAATIALRRDEVRSLQDVQRVVHEEFVSWFGAATAGTRGRYASIAGEIWEQWSVESR